MGIGLQRIPWRRRAGYDSSTPRRKEHRAVSESSTPLPSPFFGDAGVNGPEVSMALHRSSPTSGDPMILTGKLDSVNR